MRCRWLRARALMPEGCRHVRGRGPRTKRSVEFSGRLRFGLAGRCSCVRSWLCYTLDAPLRNPYVKKTDTPLTPNPLRKSPSPRGGGRGASTLYAHTSASSSTHEPTPSRRRAAATPTTLRARCPSAALRQRPRPGWASPPPARTGNAARRPCRGTSRLARMARCARRLAGWGGLCPNIGTFARGSLRK